MVALDQTQYTYQQIILEAAREGRWGNEYHIQALSVALNRPIYQYTGFKSSNGLFYLAEADCEMLRNSFVTGE